jgi:hypothetical membrane protein
MATPRLRKVSRIPRWAIASAVAAPVLLIGGWTIAETRQPPGYDAVRDTISALAARGATDRWVMTSALAGLGICYVVTACGLGQARPPGRALLVAGGTATVLVAAFPQPSHGNSVAHTVAATAAFVSLAVWPVFAARRRSSSGLLGMLPSVAATAILLGLIAWFAAEIHGGQRGLAERCAAGSESLWPLAVVLTTWRASGRRPAPAPTGTR